MPVSIPSDKNIGDLGHTTDHNQIYATLRDIAEKKIRVIEAIGEPVDGAGDPVADPADAVGVIFSGATSVYTLSPGDLFLTQSVPGLIEELWVAGSPNALDARQPEAKDILIVSHSSTQTGVDDVSLAGFTIMLGSAAGLSSPYTVLGPQPQGATGASAYEIAVTSGFVGTPQEWLDSLVGPAGPTGAEGPSGITNITVDADWTPADGVPVGTPIGTRILRRKP